MSNLRMSKLAIVAVAAGAVILLSTETTQAGGFSVRVGGLSVGAWNNGCVQSGYIYIGGYNNGWGCHRAWRSTPRYHHRPHYPTRSYRGGGHFGTMPHRRGGRHHRP